MNIGFIIISGCVFSCIIGMMYEYKKVNEWNKVSTAWMSSLLFLSWLGCIIQIILWIKYSPSKF